MLGDVLNGLEGRMRWGIGSSVMFMDRMLYSRFQAGLNEGAGKQADVS